MIGIVKSPSPKARASPRVSPGPDTNITSTALCAFYLCLGCGGGKVVRGEVGSGIRVVAAVQGVVRSARLD